MESRKDLLHHFYEESKAIEALLDQIDDDMEKNDPALVEEVQKRVEKRADTLARLIQVAHPSQVKWSKEEEALLSQLQSLEEKIKQRMNVLHQAFREQWHRFHQGKQASLKYGQGFFAYVEGAFFDKRN